MEHEYIEVNVVAIGLSIWVNLRFNVFQKHGNLFGLEYFLHDKTDLRAGGEFGLNSLSA